MKFSNLFIWGHRGLPHQYDENTLEGIQGALNAGVDGIEIDVQCAQGGEVIVLHDETLERTTSLRGFAIYTPYEEMAAEGVPQLSDVLSLLRSHRERTGKRVVLNIELKTPAVYEGVVRHLRMAMANQGFIGRDFLLSSFDQHVLLQCKRQFSDVPRALCLEGVPLNYAEVVDVLDVEAVHLCAAFPNATLIRDITARGKKVHAFTVNNPLHVQRLCDLGVSGVFTDNAPALLSHH
jgi:glycerophosphoryl diester phosphodiesterase